MLEYYYCKKFVKGKSLKARSNVVNEADIVCGCDSYSCSVNY